MFMAANATWRTTRAGAALYSPQAIHSTLLSKKSQKPRWRRVLEDEATNQAADTVTTMAGHCSADNQLSKRISLQRECVSTPKQATMYQDSKRPAN